jgi:hypothetical protein
LIEVNFSSPIIYNLSKYDTSPSNRTLPYLSQLYFENGAYSANQKVINTFKGNLSSDLFDYFNRMRSIENKRVLAFDRWDKATLMDQKTPNYTIKNNEYFTQFQDFRDEMIKLSKDNVDVSQTLIPELVNESSCNRNIICSC